MADLYTYLTSRGIVLPDTATLRADVVEEWQAIFGGDFVTTSDTAQGQLIDAETEARDSVARLSASLANQINPNLAEGVFLDALCALTGLQRIGSTQTTVTATVGGIPGTLIPAGALARTAAEADFEATADIILDDDGTGTGVFRAVDAGPVACGAGDLVTVVSAVLGWETVSNASAGVIGNDQQSDQSLRLTRRLTLAKQGQGTPEAVLSGLFDLDGVTSAVFRENTADATQVIDGITLVAHSVWACVQGATDTEVGRVLLNKRPAGIAFNGSTVVAITDATSGQTYSVLFDRPAEVPVLVRATVRNVGSIEDPQATVRAAVLDWAAGDIEGLDGLKIGVDVSPWDISTAIYQGTSGLAVSLVEASLASPVSYGTSALPIGLNEIATLSASSITVVEV